jgi:hypothetical protein
MAVGHTILTLFLTPIVKEIGLTLSKCRKIGSLLLAGSWRYFEKSYVLQILENGRFEVFKAVIIKNATLWEIETQFMSHKEHVTSPLQSPAG